MQCVGKTVFWSGALRSSLFTTSSSSSVSPSIKGGANCISCIEYESADFNARNINSIEIHRIRISFFRYISASGEQLLSRRWCEEGDDAGEQEEELSSVTSGTLHSRPPTQVRLCVIMMILLLFMMVIMMTIWWWWWNGGWWLFGLRKKTLPPSI